MGNLNVSNEHTNSQMNSNSQNPNGLGSQLRLDHFFKNSSDIMCVFDFEGNFIFVNNAFEKLIGISISEIQINIIDSFIHPEDKERSSNELKRIIQIGQEPEKFENRFILENGNIVHLEWNSTVDFENNMILSIGRDVTERKIIEQKLLRSEKLLNESQTLAKLGSWSFNFITEELYWSAETYKIYEFDQTIKGTELHKLFKSSFSPEEKERLDTLVANAIKNGVPYSSERLYTTKNGNKKWILGTGVPVKDENGIVFKVEGIIQDITEQKIIKSTIEKNILEKETLLKEVHHRVKNNMQVISSLLNLQSNITQDENLRNILNDSKERIHSMAIIHDLLYRSEDVSMVDFSDYISHLANELLNSYNGKKSNIDLNLNLPHVHYEIDVAVPLGLITNEILTNAFKHAFENKPKGAISINLSRVSANQCALTIADNGTGFDKKDISKSTSLGMMIIENLTEQLEGSLEIDSTNQGTKYKLVFKH